MGVGLGRKFEMSNGHASGDVYRGLPSVSVSVYSLGEKSSLRIHI